MTHQEGDARHGEERLIQLAESTIGEPGDDDYKLVPTQFSHLYKDANESFVSILKHTSLQETAKRYEQKDAQAIEDQTVFKKYSARITWSVFTATMITAMLAALASNPTGEDFLGAFPITLILGLAGLIAGGYSAIVGYQIANGKLLARWMSARAAAETERMGYFNRLVRMVMAGQNREPIVYLLSLELFSRYQLALQHTYYVQRGRQHSLSMFKTLKMASFAAGIIAISSGSAGVIGYFDTELLSIALLGIIGAGLATVASRREEINQDERNAERYERTADILSHLRERHSDVQIAVASGNNEVLVNYVAAVHEQLSLEHRQWLAQEDAMNAAIEKLMSSLDKQE